MNIRICDEEKQECRHILLYKTQEELKDYLSNYETFVSNQKIEFNNVMFRRDHLEYNSLDENKLIFDFKNPTISVVQTLHSRGGNQMKTELVLTDGSYFFHNTNINDCELNFILELDGPSYFIKCSDFKQLKEVFHCWAYMREAAHAAKMRKYDEWLEAANNFKEKIEREYPCPRCGRKHTWDEINLRTSPNLDFEFDSTCQACGRVVFVEGNMKTYRIPTPTRPVQQSKAPWETQYYNYPCPYCGAYKVRAAKWDDKAYSAAFWGVFSQKLHAHYKCDNCKKMWE